MTDKQIEQLLTIEHGYHRVIEHLLQQKECYISEIKSGNTDYDGITEEDVYIWFAESF